MTITLTLPIIPASPLTATARLATTGSGRPRSSRLSRANEWFPDGNDNLYGGPGNDSYWVLEPEDAAIERPNEGYDTVDVYDTDYTLGANVEKLIVNPWDLGPGPSLHRQRLEQST